MAVHTGTGFHEEDLSYVTICHMVASEMGEGSWRGVGAACRFLAGVTEWVVGHFAGHTEEGELVWTCRIRGACGWLQSWTAVGSELETHLRVTNT